MQALTAVIFKGRKVKLSLFKSLLPSSGEINKFEN